MSYPSVAIVILNYNGKNYLEKFLPSVVSSTYLNKRVIVADNASTDDSVPLLKERFHSVEIIVLEKNFGFAEGYNQALKKVETDYYVLLNSDVEVTAGWIEPVIYLMENNGKVAACQPKILSYQQKNMFEYAGACGGWIDYLGYPFCRGRIFDHCEEDNGQYNDNAEIFWATGAAMFIRATVFNEAGGFDGSFFAHMEEIDLCWRLQLSGYTIMCCPVSVVYHVGGGTLPKGNARKVFLNFRNNLFMLAKNLTIKERLWKLPVRFFFDGAFALKSLFTGEAASFTAVVRSYLAVFAWFFRRKKKYGLSQIAMRKLNGVYNRSLLWEYFVRKKRRFSDIL